MQTIPLYRYIRSDNGVTVSTNKPDVEYIEMSRLVAEEGMLITDGTVFTTCADVLKSEADKWVDFELPPELDTGMLYE